MWGSARISTARTIRFRQGMEDISKIPNLVRGLMERGFSDADILKILGGNTLRVMREVKQAAARVGRHSSGVPPANRPRVDALLVQIKTLGSGGLPVKLNDF